MLVYATIGAIGLLFLLVMLFVGDLFGGDHDVDHGGFDHDTDAGGPGFLSGRVIASFMTAFGVGGVVGRFYGLSHPASSGVGVVSGFAMAGLVYQFAKFLYGQQVSSELQVATLIGARGEVTIGIPENGNGEITVSFRGERTTHIARSGDGRAIPLGSEVVVSNLVGQSVIVMRAPAAGASASGASS